MYPNYYIKKVTIPVRKYEDTEYPQEDPVESVTEDDVSRLWDKYFVWEVRR